MLVAITLVMHGFGMLLAQGFQAQQMQRLNQRRETEAQAGCLVAPAIRRLGLSVRTRGWSKS